MGHALSTQCRRCHGVGLIESHCDDRAGLCSGGYFYSVLGEFIPRKTVWEAAESAKAWHGAVQQGSALGKFKLSDSAAFDRLISLRAVRLALIDSLPYTDSTPSRRSNCIAVCRNLRELSIQLICSSSYSGQDLGSGCAPARLPRTSVGRGLRLATDFVASTDC